MVSRRTLLRLGLGAAALLSSPPLLSRTLNGPEPSAAATGHVSGEAPVIDTLTTGGLGGNFARVLRMVCG